MAYEQDTSSLILLLADGMDWSDMNRHLFLLQEKLATNEAAIESLKNSVNIEKVHRIRLKEFRRVLEENRYLEYDGIDIEVIPIWKWLLMADL